MKLWRLFVLCSILAFGLLRMSLVALPHDFGDSMAPVSDGRKKLLSIPHVEKCLWFQDPSGKRAKTDALQLQQFQQGFRKDAKYFCNPPGNYITLSLHQNDTCHPLLRSMLRALRARGYSHATDILDPNIKFLPFYGADELTCDKFYELKPRMQIRMCLGKAWKGRFNEKDGLVRLLRSYNRTYADEIMPKTWMPVLLEDRKDLEQQIQTNPEWFAQRRFLIKNPYLDRGEGIKLVNNLPDLVQQMSSWTTKHRKSILVQEYIENLMLMNERRLSWRAYAFIINVSPLVALFHDGLFLLAPVKYNSSELKPAEYLTNDRHGIQEYDDRRRNGTLHVKDGGFYAFADDVDEMLDGRGYPDKFFDHVIRANVEEAMRIAVRASVNTSSDDPSVKHGGVSQIIGADLSLDDDGKAWLHELNRISEYRFGDGLLKHPHQLELTKAFEVDAMDIMEEAFFRRQMRLSMSPQLFRSLGTWKVLIDDTNRGVKCME